MKKSNSSLADLRKVGLRLRKLAYAKGVLRNIKGVVRVDIGYRYVNGAPTEDLSLRVFVGRKVSQRYVRKSQRIPSIIAGMPTDVIEYSAEEQVARDSRFDPLVGGISAINRRLAGEIGGTLGAIVFDDATGEPLGLSNWHVFVTAVGGKGDEIYQPAQNNPGNSIGLVKERNIDLDCAVCTLTRPWVSDILELNLSIAGIKEPRIDMSVVKSGRSTGVTYGIVSGEGTDDVTIKPDVNQPAPGEKISMPGDSGSVWIDVSSGKAVALHYKGQTATNGMAFAMRMPKVAAILKVHF